MKKLFDFKVMNMLFTNEIKFLRYNLSKKDVTMWLPPRKLPYMDLTYLLSGTMEYYYNDERIRLQSGDAILFPPGAKRQRTFEKGDVFYASFNIQFSNDFTPTLSGYLPKSVTRNTLFFLEMFQKEYHSVSDVQYEQCVALFSFLYHQLIETHALRQNPHIIKAKQYIEDHIAEKITLENLSAHIHLTPQYLSTLFRAETGQTIIEFINLRRVDFAKRLMVVYDFPLSEIAARAGFSDYPNFSRIFKRIVGVSPMQYKKLNPNAKNI